MDGPKSCICHVWILSKLNSKLLNKFNEISFRVLKLSFHIFLGVKHRSGITKRMATYAPIIWLELETILSVPLRRREHLTYWVSNQYNKYLYPHPIYVTVFVTSPVWRILIFFCSFGSYELRENICSVKPNWNLRLSHSVNDKSHHSQQ